MGWTTYHAHHYKKNYTVDRKAECDAIINSDRNEVLKSQMVGSVYYAAVRCIETGEIFAAVFLTSGKDRNDPYFNFGYKDMTEDMGPAERKCPKAILDMLTPTDSQWANEWREDCYKNLEAKKAGFWLKDLPIGSRIIATIDGKKYELVKHAPAYQYKTWFWYVPATHTSMPKTRIIPENCVPLVPA